MDIQKSNNFAVTIRQLWTVAFSLVGVPALCLMGANITLGQLTPGGRAVAGPRPRRRSGRRREMNGAESVLHNNQTLKSSRGDSQR